MTTTLTLRCRCGAIEGTLRTERPINRIVCYCDSCRAFSNFGGARIDASGGSDLYQTTAAQLTLTKGRDHLAALRMTPRGPYRWHCKECRTPLANTLASSALPFATIIVDALRGDRAALAPIQGSTFVQEAKGKALQPPASLAGMALRFAAAMPGARIRGEQKRSAFHTREGKALSEAFRMPAEERARLAARLPE